MAADSDRRLDDPDRLDALRRLSLLDTSTPPAFDRLARVAARTLGAPIGLVNIIERDSQFFKGCSGLTMRAMPISWGFCSRVLAQDAPLLLNDLRADTELAENPATSVVGIGAYAGVPLRDRSGNVLGTLCVCDYEAREWTGDDIEALADIAESVLTEITLRVEADEHSRLLAGFEDTPCLVAITRGPNHALAYANAAHQRVFGVAREGTPSKSAFPGAVESGWLPLLDRVLGTGLPARIIETEVKPHGAPPDTREYFTFVCNPLRTLAGDVDSILTVAVDVTDQMLTQQELRESRQHIRDTALTLQRSLLLEEPHDPGTLEVATRYVTGSRELDDDEGADGGQGAEADTMPEVGGDWFDVIPLGVGRTALIIGDVMGRGVRAAAVMGQMRTAVRSYARLDLPPTEILGLLDDLVEEVAPEQFVTCVYAVYDPTERELVYASAGHLPPLLVRPDGSVERLESAKGAPLGVQAGPYVAGRIRLPIGSTVALYTDGLVEDPGQDIDTGIDSLASLLGESWTELDDECDRVLKRLRSQRHHLDDAALLLFRIPEIAGRRRHSVLKLPAERASAGNARDFTAGALREWAIPQSTVDDVVLVVSELVSNALRHAGSPVELHLRHENGQIHLDVRDNNGDLPRQRPRESLEENGRGLQIVGMLGQRWGARRTEAGKSVWCEFAAPGLSLPEG
ncbi:SpoIIE family protein phosphatase [Allonocardiopsis opalescens]|uniref:protein-serine/threonine phosphatase n=1 Tax=Allonocardiopsis opalescens TaxID=1144618 RepID=A0A2T0QCQ2_9ACTN|nr:SpoIIE family protein phosphatase [Allonocardiopsis opalescens]PRY01651.1 PAS domain-containing protein [Allonocardiopsis opalescens]